MSEYQQIPTCRMQWQARPGEREVRHGANGERQFDPVGQSPKERGGKGRG